MAENELVYSLLIAVLVIVISLPLALAAAQELKRPGIRGAAAWIIVLVPLAIPAPLIGIGMITIGKSPGPVRSLPGTDHAGTGIRREICPLCRDRPLYPDALYRSASLRCCSGICPKSRSDAWTRIHLPLFAPGLVVSAGILAALTLAELGATLIVSPPGHATITMRIYNYLHYGSSSDVAGLCLMVTVLTLVISTGTILTLWWISRGSSTGIDEEITVIP